jgi:hypothetical protein
MSYVPTYLVREIFDKEVERVLNTSWPIFCKSQVADFPLPSPRWDALFPSPDLSALPRHPAVLRRMGEHYPTDRENLLIWEGWAKGFIHRYDKCITEKQIEMEGHLQDDLNAWNRNHPEKNEQIDLIPVFKEWIELIEHLSVLEISQLKVTKETAHQFTKPRFDYIKEKYGIRTNESPAPTTQPKKISIFINNDSRSSLIESIGSYIDSDDLDRLKDLVNGRPIDGRVTVHCRQNVLGKIFYIAYENGCTSASKAAFRDWICQSFEKELKGVILPLTDSTMYSHLTGLYLSKK